MTKGDRHPPRRRIVQLGPDTLLNKESVGFPGLSTEKATIITHRTFIRAPVEHCFELINKQLEETPEWDSTIMWVNPISIKHVRVGSTSRVTFNFNDITEEAVAMIRSFQPNRSILWTSTHSMQLQEEWQLQPDPHGTIVTVSLGYNPTGWIMGRLTDKIFMRRKIEKTVSEMLERLKAVAER